VALQSSLKSRIGISTGIKYGGDGVAQLLSLETFYNFILTVILEASCAAHPDYTALHFRYQHPPLGKHPPKISVTRKRLPSRKTCNGLPSKDPLVYGKAMKLQAHITAIKDVVTAIGFMITIAVLLGSALVFFIVGAWDGAVWLFKADWQTTNFQVPFWAFVVAIPAYLFNRMFAGWLKPLDHNSRRD